MVEIRLATTADVSGIAAVIQEVWHMAIDQPYCQELIAKQKISVRVADDQGEVAGFAAGFVTTVQGAIRRWEVDLVAVRTANQGQGLGQKLIEASSEDAQANQVKFMRGLVRVENFPSQRAFERAGYETNGQVYDMYLWSPQKLEAALPSRMVVSVIPVETLTYRGLWLEGLDSPMISDEDRRAYVAGGRASIAKDGRLNASALVPVEKPLPDDLRDTATLHGQYQWWRRS